MATCPNFSSNIIFRDINITRTQNTPGRRSNRDGPFCQQSPNLMPNGKGGGAFVAAPYSPSPFPYLLCPFPPSHLLMGCALCGAKKAPCPMAPPANCAKCQRRKIDGGGAKYLRRPDLAAACTNILGDLLYMCEGIGPKLGYFFLGTLFAIKIAGLWLLFGCHFS